MYVIALIIFVNFCMAMALVSRMRGDPGPQHGRLAGQAFTKARKYTLYVGLNDKDSHTPLVPADAAEQRLNAVAFKHASGFTVSRAKGFWLDDDGIPTHEDTLIYIFMETSEEQISAILDGMLAAMNQSSILVEATSGESLFYRGAN